MHNQMSKAERFRLMPTRKRLASYVALSALFVASGGFSVASAQDAGNQAAPTSSGQIGEVVVTGSKILRPINDQLEPAITVSSEFIKERGLTNVADILEQIPGISFGATSLGNQNGFSLGQNFVNIFNIGSQRTLVLVDGRRFTPGQTQSIFSNDAAGLQVDLNTIPTELIDHIDTILVGGSSIYGADAIAGTVNVVLKQNFEGVVNDVQFGRSNFGDGNSYSARTLIGVNTDDKRGNVEFSAEFNQSNGLLQSQRPFSANEPANVANPSGNGPNIFIHGLTNPSANTNGVIFANVLNSIFPAIAPNGGLASLPGQTNGLQFAPGGNIVPFNPGTVFPDQNGQGGQGFDGAAFNTLLTNTRRINVSVLAHYDVTDWATAYTELHYSHSDASTPTGGVLPNEPVLDGEATGNSPTDFANAAIQFNNNNLFLNQQAKSTLAAAGLNNFFLSRFSPELIGPTTGIQDQYDAVFGVKGDFDLLSRKAHYDVSLTLGGNYASNTSVQLNEQNFLNALGATDSPNGVIVANGPVVNPANGQLACPVTLTNPNSKCAPLNLFGGGAPSQAAINYILSNDVSHNILQQDDANGSISLPVLTLPGGDVSIATGFEVRREFSSFSPGPNEAGGLGQTIPVNSIAGGYYSYEGFGELLVPVVSPDMNVPLIHSLQLDGSYRRVDNNVVGADHALTYGGRYAPTGDLQFRGNFSRAIRAPAITELFTPGVRFFEGATDPCDSAQLNSGPNPAARQRNCAAAQAAAGFTGAPNSFFSNADVTNPPGVLQGNTGLKNEISDSWTTGVVFTPTFIPHLTASADWVHIKVDNTINSVSSSAILSACFDSNSFPNAACNFITRFNSKNAPTPGQVFDLASVGNPFLNGGTIDYQGLVGQLSYRLPLEGLPFNLPDLGLLDLNTTLNYNASYNQVIGSGAFASQDPLTDSLGNPRYRAQINTTYSYDRYSLLWQSQFTGPVNINDLFNSTTQNVLRVGSYWLFNATAGVDVTDDVRVRFIVNNVFNSQPPFGLTVTQAIGNYDVFGRGFQLGVTAKF